ncbi:MAG TPA: protease inhibitor I42 family protein [Candidatus Acidoferrum sp.]|jgi:inhibitor of cysteine peptidase
MRSSRRWGFDLLVLILLSACGAGCSHTALTIKADQNYNGRTINLRVGDGVKVTLAENPTTGYKWEFLAQPEPVCVTVGDAYVANPAMGTIGGGGAHEWNFRAVGKGTGTLSLGYRRPWEKDAAPAKTFTLTMVVK